MTRELDDYEDRLERLREARLRALGTRSPRCTVAGCKETDPFALTSAAPDIFCREHRADDQGHSWTEEHHVAGQRNDPFTIPLPANDHGSVSARQSLWDRETLRNDNASPLLRIAARIHGWTEIMRTTIERGVGEIPQELERLDKMLEEKLGPRWWEILGWWL